MNSGGYFSIERNENGFSLYCVKDMEDVMSGHIFIKKEGGNLYKLGSIDVNLDYVDSISNSLSEDAIYNYNDLIWERISI